MLTLGLKRFQGARAYGATLLDRLVDDRLELPFDLVGGELAVLHPDHSHELLLRVDPLVDRDGQRMRWTRRVPPTLTGRRVPVKQALAAN